MPDEVTPLDQVDFAADGAVGRKMTALFQTRFMSDEARTAIYDEAENAFKTHFDDLHAPIFGWWQGEYWGKTMLSAAEVYSLTKDETPPIGVIENATEKAYNRRRYFRDSVNPKRKREGNGKEDHGRRQHRFLPLPRLMLKAERVSVLCRSTVPAPLHRPRQF